MWNWFSKAKAPEAPPVSAEVSGSVHVITPEISLKDLAPASNVIFRKMKWVTDEGGQTGIIADFDSSGNALVHYVNEATGETTRTANVRVSALRLAKFKEIPEIRRQGLSPQAAAVLGYF